MEKAHQNGGLLDALLAAQKIDGYVTEEAMHEAAAVFGMTPAAVYDAASYYTMLHLAPGCAHEIRICGSAPCHVAGSEDVRKAVEDYLGIRIGETSEDRRFRLTWMACQGRCGEGPAIAIDGSIYTKVTAGKAVTLLKEGGI